MKKIILVAALAAALFTGCGGVDKQKLAQLTGDKTFEEVKVDYKKAYFYEKADEVEVYAHYLKKNEDKVVGFDFESFSGKTHQDYKNIKKEIDTKMKELRDNLKNISLATLSKEIQSSAFFIGRALPLDNAIKELQQLKKDKWAMIEEEKKAKEKAENEAAKNRGEKVKIEIDISKGKNPIPVLPHDVKVGK